MRIRSREISAHSKKRREGIMPNINLNNYGVACGRLAADPKVFGPNKDGSHSVMLTVITDGGKAKSGERITNSVPLQFYVGPSMDVTAYPYGTFKQGDRVRASFRVDVNSYEADGETEYKTTLIGTSLEADEPKGAREARHQAPADAAA